MNWKLCFCLAGLAAASSLAQGWEIGAIGGFGYTPSLTVTGRTGSASTGFKNGGVLGAYGGEDTYRYFGGEARYLYRYSDMKLSSGGTSVTFGGNTQLITGDILGYFRPTESHVRPFVEFGGGLEILQGTGIESAAQPLGNFAALTNTQELLPVADIGVGLKTSFGQRMRFRVEVHDYIGPTPSKVIAPAPGASLNGVMNGLVASASIGISWH